MDTTVSIASKIRVRSPRHTGVILLNTYLAPLTFLKLSPPPSVGSRTLCHTRIVRDLSAVVPHHRVPKPTNYTVPSLECANYTAVPALHLTDAWCLTEFWKVNPHRDSRLFREHSLLGSEFFCQRAPQFRPSVILLSSRANALRTDFSCVGQRHFVLV